MTPTAVSPTAIAGVSASCPNPEGGTCRGPLDPGTYRTLTFQPRITYTVPAGWVNAEDLPGNFWLYLEDDLQDGPAGGSYLGIYQNIHAAAINCAEDWQEGVGTTPEHLVAWYRSIPGVEVSEPQPVTVGGLSGLQIDISQIPGAGHCVFDGNGPPATPLLIGDGVVSGLHHNVGEEYDVRLVILAWRDRNVTLEITSVHDQHPTEEYHALVQPIVDSLEFFG